MDKERTVIEGNYWMVIAQKQPIIKDHQVPVYWHKNFAERDAAKYGGKVVEVKCTWSINNQKSPQ